MKKFLSLLLAMTMVMSLIVLPARAADGITGTLSVEKGQTTTLTAPDKPSKVSVDGKEYTVTSANPTYNWISATTTVATVPETSHNNTVSVSGVAAGTSKITCEMTVTYDIPADSASGTTASTGNHKITKEATVTVTDCTDGVASITCNGITSNVSSKQADYYTATAGQPTDASAFTPNPKSGYEIKGTSTYDSSNKKLTVPIVLYGSASSVAAKDTVITLSEKVVSLTTVAATTSPSSGKYYTGQNITFTATGSNVPTGAQYIWTYSKDSGASQSLATTTTNTLTTKAFTIAGSYVVSCKVKFGTQETAAVAAAAITVEADAYTPAFNGTALPGDIIVYNSSNQKTTQLPTPYLKSGKVGVADVPFASLTGVTYKSSSDSIATVNNSGSVTAASTAGTATITVSFTYQNKDYSETYNIYNRAPSHTIPTSIQAGAATPYDTATLKLYASTALSSAGINIPVTSITTVSSVAAKSNCTVTQPTYGSTTYYVTGGTFGTATFTATVSTLANGTYPVTFSVAVKPQTTTYEDQYPTPVAYGNTYRYAVQVPSGFTSYYVLGTPNQTTEPNWTLTGTQYYGSTLYYLTDANFVGGKCTLWLVTKDSYGRYYCGQLTVYQQNHDIKYNGVVGNTVQFKHNDFTTFMNEMYGTNTTSYLTFNSVKFTSVPNATSQGTLYYSGSAMTTGYGSNYFNTNTAVANLDNVSFAVSSKVPSTTKEIRIPFTLYATRYNSYGSYGTGSGTSVTYSGAVVISLVREDVTFTVAPGDAVTFTDSNFLNYLRAQSGINYNYNIDYVTFDQSAVDTINGGVLYSGYAGYNQVKTTDKFYYTTTNNYTQNALSDVTFRASLYAKTGTTVYIPFTIYARYGTTGAATRQVTGTVAVKIAQTMNFVDVKPTDYFYNPVKWAVTKNITKGTSAVTFSPDKTCTRAEIVTFLWRDAGSPMPTISRHPFTDVSYSMGADFYNAILWASQNGITAGTSTTTFSPNKTCTRAEIVTFLWRYAKKPVGYGSNSFTDVNKNDHAPYYDAILWAVSKGITNGSTTTTFAPNGTCTRAQAVTFLYRYEGGK